MAKTKLAIVTIKQASITCRWIIHILLPQNKKRLKSIFANLRKLYFSFIRNNFVMKRCLVHCTKNEVFQ